MWRFLPIEYKSAAENMAIDEAILNAHLRGEVPPTLRLYKFAPHAVSLGYAQKVKRENVQAASDCGFDLVRRPSGGRAVLHSNDLTYSFVASSDPNAEFQLAKSIRKAYLDICDALICAIHKLGITVRLGEGFKGYGERFNCFDTTTAADLQYQGRKLLGSAQLRRQTAVLQHGSLPLIQPRERLGKIMGLSTEDKGVLPTLFEAAGREFSESELNRAFENGFASTFGHEFEKAGLTAAELAEVGELRARYLDLQLA